MSTLEKRFVTLLELDSLEELEQGILVRIYPNSFSQKLHPNTRNCKKIARRLPKDCTGELQRGQREHDTFEILLDACQLFALINDIFFDKTFHQTRQQLTSSKRDWWKTKNPTCN
jgi:hypothetical protein